MKKVLFLLAVIFINFSTAQVNYISGKLNGFQDGDKISVISCTCAGSVRDSYEPVFDVAMKSFKNEGKISQQ